MYTEDGFVEVPEERIKSEHFEKLNIRQKCKLAWDKLPVLVYTAMFLIGFSILTLACAINGINIFMVIYNTAHIMLWTVFLAVVAVFLWFYIQALFMELNILPTVKKQITHKD